MKDRHNIILILVSSSLFNFFSGVVQRITFSVELLIFFPGVPSFHFISSQSFIQSLQGFTLCFQFLFVFIPLFTGVLHGGSTWCFIKELIPSRSFHRDSFLGSSSISSSCNPECNFFFHIIGGGIRSFLII